MLPPARPIRSGCFGTGGGGAQEGKRGEERGTRKTAHGGLAFGPEEPGCGKNSAAPNIRRSGSFPATHAHLQRSRPLGNIRDHFPSPSGRGTG
ncbi:Hypothetical protein AA314_02228 [Archangium gephyra]|uniref:Uncharacterized protein n=1 Tax=Archangium gephyra TaxID=48 RepID=A0AAC8TC45_9BACT|nr:Hypothetical protein AA314_02228 [Archangium gephyra]